jgi:NADH-quinone oxidoreductase subunit F
MPSLHRVLDQHPIDALADYVAIGGGAGLDAARRLGGVGIAEEVAASGLRGRGGAGFPTGVKWETVAAEAGTGPPPIVVVNGAEGEPGSFKDRTLLRRNPYRVLEGALIAATAVHAHHVVVALKRSFQIERRRVVYAIAEMSDAGWLSDIDVRVSIGPNEYLFGEETALLEVVEGRQPFPRIAPPYRRGLTTGTNQPTSEEPGSNDAPGVGLVLANNVETLANVPGIVSQGADWFRSLGTTDSPGTVVCTVSGDTRRAGVAEFPMGTTIAEIVDEIGGGALDQQRIIAAISGVANAILPVELFDTPACYDALRSVGSGLGAAGFIVFDDRADLIAVAQGVSHFLAVESCGQCEPCKRDGMAVATMLDDLRRSESEPDAEATLRDLLATITDGARCYLATQHQVVATSILDLYPVPLAGHVDGSLPPADPVLIAPIVDIEDGQVILDASQADKQPDWSYEAADSGRWPAAYLGDTPVDVSARRSRLARGAGAVPPTDGSSDVDDADRVDLVDADHRPIVIDVGDQLDLAHHELVAALLATAGGDGADRAAAVEAFADQLQRHVQVTTQVLLPWVRRVGGDEGERVAERAEAIQSAATDLVETLRRAPSPASSDGPTDAASPGISSQVGLRALADQLHRLILDEERRVLPLLERHLGESELNDIGRAMHEV